jgi:hypothetical protein
MLASSSATTTTISQSASRRLAGELRCALLGRLAPHRAGRKRATATRGRRGPRPEPSGFIQLLVDEPKMRCIERPLVCRL